MKYRGDVRRIVVRPIRLNGILAATHQRGRHCVSL